jgi:hypothetical protein
MGRLQRGSAHEPPLENVTSARNVARSQARRAAVRPGCASGLGCCTGGGYVRSVHAPEPPVDLRFMIWIERLRPTIYGLQPCLFRVFRVVRG